MSSRAEETTYHDFGSAEYIAGVLPELRILALADGHEVLAYLIGIVTLEAGNICRSKRAAVDADTTGATASGSEGFEEG